MAATIREWRPVVFAQAGAYTSILDGHGRSFALPNYREGAAVVSTDRRI
jgi:hypothetical protein